MTTVRDVSNWLENFAPRRLAEEWDNVGLLWGNPNAAVERVMTCLTVTTGTAQEAVNERAELIVSHHPVLFRAVKRVVASESGNGMLWTLAKAGVSILSPHTAFDNTKQGINDGLARRMGLVQVQPLRASAGEITFKLVVFTPEQDRESVLSAAFVTGAGKIGAYGECSFAVDGVGTFFGGDGSNPTIGRAGRTESVNEKRLEVVCPANRLSAVVAAMRSAHSYEEPAIDVYPLQSLPGNAGAGRVGNLSEPTTLAGFAKLVKDSTGATRVQMVGDEARQIRRVAIVCGAGDDFLGDAVKAKADVLVTGEARFHRALEAESLGIGMIVAGHHATERPGVEDLAVYIAKDFPELKVWASREERDPLKTLG